MNIDNIPQEVKTAKVWLNWKYEEREGKQTKVPYQPNGNRAKANDPATWHTFEEVVEYMELEGEETGIGLVLRDDLIGIDLDKCRNPETGAIDDWAEKIIKAIDSYTEISPSDKGIRILCRGIPQAKGSRHRAGAIEIYDHNSPRYLTITGNRIEGEKIEWRQDRLEALYRELFPVESKPVKSEKKPTTPVVYQDEARTDQELQQLEKQWRQLHEVACEAANGEKFMKLFSGDLGDYPSHSEARMALLTMMAFYTGNNGDLLDEWFCQSGQYMAMDDERWERLKKREMGRAVELCQGRLWQPEATIPEQIHQLAAQVESKKATPVVLEVAVSETKIEQAAKGKRPRLNKWDEVCRVADSQTEDWLVPGWAEFGTLLLLTGLPFSGKSMLVAEMIAAMALDKPFLGKQVTPCPIVLFDLENKERTLVTGIRRALGNDQGSIQDLFRMVDRENIPRPLTPQFIVDALVELQTEIGQAEVQRGVVIVDTFRTAFVPDTNGEQEMLKILVPLKSLAQKTGWLVMALHHNAKATNAYSGSTAIAGVADYLWNWTKNIPALTNLLSQEGRGDYEEPQRFEYDTNLKTLVWTGADSYHREKVKESATEEKDCQDSDCHSQ